MALDSRVRAEVADRLAHGGQLVTVAEMSRRFAALGYRLDRTMDCRSVASIVSGRRAGETYPVCTTGLKEADTGRSAWHFEGRRDDRYRQMQRLRGEVFAISRGAILEV